MTVVVLPTDPRPTYLHTEGGIRHIADPDADRHDRAFCGYLDDPAVLARPRKVCKLCSIEWVRWLDTRGRDTRKDR
jgi:hypothetical protein